MTVCYNAVTEIERTIQSVIGQSYPNIEYIIIDGGSKDGTVDLIRKYADKLAYWISEPDKGIYDAMNKGIAVSTGDWICFLNAGDWFAGTRVLAEVGQEAQNTQAIILCGKMYQVTNRFHYLIGPKPLELMNQTMPLLHPASFIRTTYHKKHLFDISYRSSGDYHFFHHAYYVDRVDFQYISVVVSYFDATHGMSKDNYNLTRLENLRFTHAADYNKAVLGLRIRFAYEQIRRWVGCLITTEAFRRRRQESLLRAQGYELLPNNRLTTFLTD